MRRFNRDSTHEALVKSLTTGDRPLFGEIWRLMIFAALLGYRLNLRESLNQVDSGKAIPVTYFEGNPAFRGLLYLLGIVESNDTLCLRSGDEAEETVVKIFEEYTNGGLRYLGQEVGESSDSFGRVLDIVMRFGVPIESAPKPDLSSLI